MNACDGRPYVAPAAEFEVPSCRACSQALHRAARQAGETR